MKSVMSERGQITIPKIVREILGLRPGTVLELVAEDGRLIGTKALSHDPLRKWRGRGRLPGGKSVNEYLAEIRDADRG